MAIAGTPVLIDTNTPRDRRILVYNKVTGWYQSRYTDGGWPYYGWEELTTGELNRPRFSPSIHFPSPTHWMEQPDKPQE